MGILVLLFSLLVIDSAIGWGQLEQDALDDYVENFFMPINHIPGLSISIVENNTVVVSKGYGVQNIEFNIPTDENTLMGIGSNTKGITGVIVAKTLAETFPELGHAVLDTPIRRLLPNGNFTFSDRYRSEFMSFRDLLSHRHCLDPELDADINFNSVPDIEEKLYRTRYQTEICQFRTGVSYNNALVALAGELVAQIKGVSYIQLLLDFTREIGMETLSYFDREGNFQNNPHMATAYLRWDNVTEVYNPRLLARMHAAVGAGGVMVSAKDMAAYMKFHLNKGKVGDRQVVSEEVMGWIYTIANPFKSADFGTLPDVPYGGVYAYIGYSLGFIHSIYDGWAEIQHGGYWPTFESSFKIYPDLKHGIYTAANGPGSIGLESGITQEHLSSKIFSLLQEMTPLPPPKQLLIPLKRDFEIDLGRLPIISSPKEYPHLVKRKGFEASDLIGLYGHPLNGDMIIRIDPDEPNETLEMNIGEFGIGTLREYILLPGIYKIEWKTDIIQFFRTLQVPDYLSFLDLRYENTAIFSLMGGTYIKDQTLETLPVIPWLPDSCGPSI